MAGLNLPCHVLVLQRPGLTYYDALGGVWTQHRDTAALIGGVRFWAQGLQPSLAQRLGYCHSGDRQGVSQENADFVKLVM